MGSLHFTLSLYHHRTPVERTHQSHISSLVMRAECLCVPMLCALCCFMPSALLSRAKCASGIYQISGFLPVVALPSGTVLLPCSLQVPTWLQHISDVVLIVWITWKALADNWYFVSFRKSVNSYLAKAICTRVWQEDSLNEVQVQNSQVPLEGVMLSKELLNSRPCVNLTFLWECRMRIDLWSSEMVGILVTYTQNVLFLKSCPLEAKQYPLQVLVKRISVQSMNELVFLRLITTRCMPAEIRFKKIKEIFSFWRRLL